MMRRRNNLFEKLSNFELNPQDVQLPIVNMVLKRMPQELAEQIFVFANTHFRACQYDDWKPLENEYPQLSFWNSVYYKQLGLIEDYECQECEDCDTPDKAISQALLLGAGIVVGGVVGATGAGGASLTGTTGPLLLPAATPFIDVVGTALKAPASSLPSFSLTTTSAQFPVLPVNVDTWNQAEIGAGFVYRIMYHILNPTITGLTGIGTGGSIGNTAVATLSDGSFIPPNTIVVNV